MPHRAVRRSKRQALGDGIRNATENSDLNTGAFQIGCGCCALPAGQEKLYVATLQNLPVGARFDAMLIAGNGNQFLRVPLELFFW
jgi:hypothetical protein